jgi:hypothetical protein
MRFEAIIEKFGNMGEKTGWSYVRIPEGIALKLKPGNRKSFRVKGKLDKVPIERIALLPMGEGEFILVLKSELRRKLGKHEGDSLSLKLEPDERPPAIPELLMECLRDEPLALEFFNGLPLSHRNYFGTWIRTAKTEATRAKRVAESVNALAKKMNFGQMSRALKAKNGDWG